MIILDQSQNTSVEFTIAQQYRLIRLEGEPNALLQARVQRYRIPDRRTVATVVAAMQGDARILLAQPNFIHLLQGKPGAGSLLELQYAPDRLQLAAAHGMSHGRNAVIAVIDSRIDFGHGELQGAISEACDAVRDGDTRPDPHGTAIAGIIASRGRFRGIAPEARLLAVRAFFRERNKGPLTTTYILLRAMGWASARQARIYNLSFAGPHDKAFQLSINAVRRAGAILIAAAGNGGPRATAVFPAAFGGVIAVTAVDKADKLYAKANHGRYIALAAPGVDVLAPVPGNGFDFKSGTSFAAAHVSGLVALLMELKSSLTGDEALALLAAGAVDLGPKGQDPQFGAGRVDALAAMKASASIVAQPTGNRRLSPASHAPPPPTLAIESRC